MNQGNLGFSAERYYRGFSNGFFLKAKRYSRIVHLRFDPRFGKRNNTEGE